MAGEQHHQRWRFSNTRSIWNCNAHWLVDLREDHSKIPEQGQVIITVADIQERVSNMKTWTAQDPKMIHAY